MRKTRQLVLAAILIVLLVILTLYEHRPTAGTEQAPAIDAPAGPAGLAPGRLLVDLVDDVTAEQVADLERRYGIDLQLNSVHAEDDQLQVAAVSEARIHHVIDQLRREGAVEVAERDGLYGVTGWFTYEPNDPQRRYQWHMDQIRMPEAWHLSRGRGAVVAVIDTGVAYADSGDTYRQVPDLARTGFVAGYDFVDDDAEPYDEHGHGTHVAGTIAQSTNNGEGVSGVAFEARIMPIRVLNRQGYGSYADIADAIRWAADNGADVINMSLGGPIPSIAIWRAVAHARSRGVVVVAAAGNTGGRGVQYPGALSQVIGVSATRFDEEITFYSSWGPQVDVAAPGGDTRVDQNGDGMADGVLQNTILPGSPAENDYLLFNGTSMASPHVAGVAALLVAEGVSNPAAVERIMERTARLDGRDPQHYGAGIVDAAAAVRWVQLGLGAIRLALGLALAGLMILGLRQKNRLDGRPGVGLFAGVLVGASGLFFLPQLVGGLIPEAVLGFLSRPLMAWDLALLGAAGHANPLFHSALVPVALTLLLFGVKWTRPVVAGLALGGAAYLVVGSLWGTIDVTYLPYRFLDHAWLWANAVICLLVASVSLRRD
jgi:serine protease